MYRTPRGRIFNNEPARPDIPLSPRLHAHTHKYIFVEPLPIFRGARYFQFVFAAQSSVRASLNLTDEQPKGMEREDVKKKKKAEVE